MFTSETLTEVIENQQINFTMRFNHIGVVDAEYAKQFIMLVNCGIITIDTKIKALQEPPKQPEAVNIETPSETK